MGKMGVNVCREDFFAMLESLVKSRLRYIEELCAQIPAELAFRQPFLAI